MKTLLARSHADTPEKIYLELSDKPVPSFDKNNEVLIKVLSSGINPSDALATLGYFPHAVVPRIPGRDFSGIIEDGPEEYIGKAVWGTGGDAGISRDGTQSEFIKLPLSALAIIPKNINPNIAGALALPYVTAFYSLHTRGRIQAGEYCLISGALGQVGKAAMAICYWKKAKPVALVRGNKQIADAEKRGWTAIDSTNPDLKNALKNAT